MKKLLLIALNAFFFSIAGAQTKADIFTKSPVTWLGLDFTQLKYIGSANQFKDAGTISNIDLHDKYFEGWNQLFISEQKKYNIAAELNRDNVSYAIEITGATNRQSTGQYFTGNSNDYQLLDRKKIDDLVAAYDFKGSSGMGLIFFVEGMDKNNAEASMWVTFVNMGTKTVLLAKRRVGKAGGFGFRNYWAKTFYNVLKDMDLSNWNGSHSRL